ncbi:MAG TPA: ABC transporter ATP-binding protein [bacterium]|jgi:ABC-2 type transport system ATP-binding protein
MDAMQQAAIEVEGLSKRYGEVIAVDDVSFSVQHATTTGLLGGNGAGKTTTLSMLVGLLLPTAGRIRVLGEDMLRHRFRVLARMNYSSPYVDLPHRLTVWENLRVYAGLYGIPRSRERIDALAAELNFAALLKRPYGSLSAGQKTRVALAKALLNEPEVLLMDEPTASLDPDMADYVRNYLKSYQRRTGATMLLASHNMTEVERICDDVIILREGRRVTQGAPDALIARYGRQTLEDVFIDIARRRRRGAEDDVPPGLPPAVEQREAAP